MKSPSDINIDEYRNRIYDFLERMPVGSVYVLDTLCRQENKELFISIVKEFIWATRRFYCYGIEFTNDYSRLRKMDVSGLPALS